MGDKKTNKQRKMKKSSRRKNGGEDEGKPRETITDERFASVLSDPRFMEPPKKRSKVVLDSRFSRILTDPRFVSSKAPIDKHGKPKDKKSAATSLKRFYHLRKEEEEEDEDEDDEGNDNAAGGLLSESESKKLSNRVDDDDDVEAESSDESSLSGSTTDDSDVGSDEEEDYNFLQPEENVPDIDKETRRLAVVNLDWSQIRAVDLLVLLSSFLPKGGQILSVAVYPSEFGHKRMAEEAVHGPLLFDDEKKSDGEEKSDDDDDEIDNKKLRAYELTKLRYYFAVVECDSISTADYLYKECDGTEVERSANKLDLRFIPDSMEFKHPPRDVATEAPTGYEGLLNFETKALAKSDVPLTWDEEDELPRQRAFRRIFNSNQQGDMDLNEYLASDESDNDAEDNDALEDNSEKKQKKRERYLSLIQMAGVSDEEEEKADGQDMEVTFNSGLEDISKRILEKKDKKSESVWDAYLRKKKEKKKLRKNRSKDSSEDESSGTDEEADEQPDDFFVEEHSDVGSKAKRGTSFGEKAKDAEASTAELELLLADEKETGTNLKGYKLKSKKSKKGQEIVDPENVPTLDYSDPRFSALLTKPLFALDPTDPQFKRSAAYARQMALKQKMADPKNAIEMDYPTVSGLVGSDETVKSVGGTQTKEKHELSSLIRSIKMKSRQIPLPSQGNILRKHENLLHKVKKRKQEN